MRVLLAATALLMLTTAAGAMSARQAGPSGQDNATPQASVRGGVATHGAARGLPGHGGHRGGRGGGVIIYPYPPYPVGWPYPPYPYPYPYPYPTYPYPYPDDDSDDYPMPSTRGLVVPGDMPVGIMATWYYCDTPDGYYPYVKTCQHPWAQIPVAPPPPGAATPVSYSDWQWCEESKAFFPYVSSCKAGFVSVPVTVPGKDQAGPPQTANWFFCNDPKGYAPYVVQCKGDWRPVPAVPPPSVKITVRDGSDAKGR